MTPIQAAPEKQAVPSLASGHAGAQRQVSAMQPLAGLFCGEAENVSAMIDGPISGPSFRHCP
jgi:hypothetical protein